MNIDNYPYLKEFIQALNDEIKILEHRGESEIRVSDGVLSKIEAGEYIYSFVAEEALIVTDDQPIEISYQGRRYKAILIGRVGNTLLVATNDNLGEKLDNAILIISPIFLLKALISVIEQLPNLENYNFNFPDSIINKKLLPDTISKSIDGKVNTSHLNDFQKEAIETALGSKLTFIWGPPGTGKTTVIGKIVEDLLQNNQRVLITSHTNIAVDTALRDVLENKDSSLNEGIKEFYKKGQLLRYGVHQLPSLDKYPLIFGTNIAAKNSEELLARLPEIDREEARLLEENKIIEMNIDSTRLLQHIIDKRKDLEERIIRLNTDLENAKKTLGQSKEKYELVKQQLQKAQKNNWFSNMIQGLNAGKLLQDLEQTQRSIEFTNNNVARLTQDISTAETKLENIKREISLQSKGLNIEEISSVQLVGSLEDNLKRTDELRSERRTIQDQIDQLSKLVLNSAKVVATTLTKCYLRSELLAQYFDVVVIDEISMAQIPHLFVAIGMGKRVILVGDFLQLPPIVQAETNVAKKWLGQSLYDYFKIPNIFLTKGSWPKQVKPLFKQYRMHPDISNLINQYVYKGNLENDEKTKQDRETRANLAPFSGHIAFFNTSNIFAYCRKKEGRSRYTLKNAFLDLYLAAVTVPDYLKERQIDEDERIDIVGIVTPYRAQANLISKLLVDLQVKIRNGDYPLARFVEANTVHKFQGNQRQVIIFDTTDDFPMFKPAGIVDDAEDAGEDIKLINVAVTRAKDKFLLLGNGEFIKSKHSNTSLIKNILPLINNNGITLDFSSLLKSKLSKNLDISLFNDLNELQYIIDDSKASIQLIISDLFETDLFKSIKDNLLAAVKIGVSMELFTQLPSLYSNDYVKLAEETIQQLQNNGFKCHLRTKFRDHLIIFDRERIYCFFDQKDANGIQLKSVKGVKELVRLFNLEDDQPLTPCPKCTKEGRNGMLVLRQGPYGTFYGCSLFPKCKFIDRNKKEDDIDKKLEKLDSKCPECGKPIKKKKNRYGRFFWGCSGYPECKHIVK